MVGLIKSRAAVAFEPNKPLQLVEVDVEPPREGEVRIRIISTGLCHTDLYTLAGRDPEGRFPCILGHEGAGVVESVGPGVTSVSIGEEVIPLYAAECQKCKFCTSGKTNLCGAVRTTQGEGVMPDGTSRFSYKGQTVYHFMGCSTLSEYTVVAEVSLAKLNSPVHPTPFDRLCLLGCGITTGMGAVLNTARIEEGAVIAVFGLGVIGLSVVLAASRLRKAKRIIGIDLDERKFHQFAKPLGCHEYVNPMDLLDDRSGESGRPSMEKLRDKIIQMTDGGVDYSFECVGNVDLMRCALESSHKGWGQSIIIGVAGQQEEIRTRPFQLVTGRQWKGSAFGGVKGRSELGKFVQWAVVPSSGTNSTAANPLIPLEMFVTHKFKFEEINRAVSLMSHGTIGESQPDDKDVICLRPVMSYGPIDA